MEGGVTSPWWPCHGLQREYAQCVQQELRTAAREQDRDPQHWRESGWLRRETRPLPKQSTGIIAPLLRRPSHGAAKLSASLTGDLRLYPARPDSRSAQSGA